VDRNYLCVGLSLSKSVRTVYATIHMVVLAAKDDGCSLPEHANRSAANEVAVLSSSRGGARHVHTRLDPGRSSGGIAREPERHRRHRCSRHFHFLPYIATLLFLSLSDSEPLPLTMRRRSLLCLPSLPCFRLCRRRIISARESASWPCIRGRTTWVTGHWVFILPFFQFIPDKIRASLPDHAACWTYRISTCARSICRPVHSIRSRYFMLFTTLHIFVGLYLIGLT
jgi:hypothetical protein